VADFIFAHLRENGPARLIVDGQAVEMCVEMLGYLALGFGQKAEAELVPGKSGSRTDGERTEIPQRCQPAGSAAELFDARTAPGEMIAFLLSCSQQRIALSRITRKHGLTPVERLRSYFTAMVHTHQASALRALVSAESVGPNSFARRGLGGLRRASNHPQCCIGFSYEPVEGTEISG
jgi:hypothetical protein